jgi:hypothetical protein
MNSLFDATPSTIDRIRRSRVAVQIPRALDARDQVFRRLEHGKVSTLEAIKILLSEVLALCENSRIKTAHEGACRDQDARRLRLFVQP